MNDIPDSKSYYPGLRTSSLYSEMELENRVQSLSTSLTDQEEQTANGQKVTLAYPFSGNACFGRSRWILYGFTATFLRAQPLFSTEDAEELWTHDFAAAT